jgi:hypothetical protein
MFNHKESAFEQEYSVAERKPIMAEHKRQEKLTWEFVL